MPKLTIYVSDYLEKLQVSIDGQLLDMKSSLINNRFETNLTAGKHQLSIIKKPASAKEFKTNVLEFWITMGSTLKKKTLEAVVLDCLYELEIYDDSKIKIHISSKDISVVESTCPVNELNKSFKIDEELKRKVKRYYAIPLIVLCVLVVAAFLSLSVLCFYYKNYLSGIVVVAVSLFLSLLFFAAYKKAMKNFKTAVPDKKKRQ